MRQIDRTAIWPGKAPRRSGALLSLGALGACHRAVQSVVTCHYGSSWDTGDYDFSSGGVSVVPQQPGPTPFLLTAAGKSCARYLLTAQALGEFTPKGPNNDGAEQAIGPIGAASRISG